MAVDTAIFRYNMGVYSLCGHNCFLLTILTFTVEYSKPDVKVFCFELPSKIRKYKIFSLRMIMMMIDDRSFVKNGLQLCCSRRVESLSLQEIKR